MPLQRIVSVAVPCPLYRLFDYRLAEVDQKLRIMPGMRVRVPFGRQKLVGIVLDEVKHSEIPESKLKTVIAVLDDSSLLSSEILQLLRWAASYYASPIGEVFQTALPAYLRKHEDPRPSLSVTWKPAGSSKNNATTLKRAPKQFQVLQYIEETGKQNGVSAQQLNEFTANWRPAVMALEDKGLLERIEQPIVLTGTPVAAPCKLNPEQQQTIENIQKQISQHSVHLINGVTGSGKTEVYLALSEPLLKSSRQVLIMVPEIGLTPQLTRRFQQRLDTTICVLHSRMNHRQRYAAWHAATQGQAQLIIGTRSSIFTPIPDLGLIIIDEEHDNSYKQQDGFRYNARDLAIVRARNLNIPVVLGSATASLESLNNTNEQRYIPHYLKQRANRKALPDISLVNMCSQRLNEGVADSVLQHIAGHLKNEGQVLLFINRRGYAPLLMCHDCGWTTRCHQCDAHMTFHQHRHQLHCHHCGSQRRAPDSCEDCGSEEIIAVGAGTERIEQFLQQHFPSATVSRIDRDTTRNKGMLQQKLDEAHRGEADILVGTQMLAKGHDFPNITLVCILDTDQALFSADFRASEHLAQLITQVSGRAGRADKKGEVLIQTHHPDHPLLQTLLHEGYAAFADSALAERKAAGLPPKRYLALIRCESVSASAAPGFLEDAINLTRQIDRQGVELYGPLPAPMERRAGRYRFQLMLQAGERKPLLRLLNWLAPQMQQMKSARKVRWSIDVDPYDTY